MSVMRGIVKNIAGAAGKPELPVHLFGEASKSTRGVILVQEWWGVNDQMREFARRFSEHPQTPYVSLIPDIYRGVVANDAQEAEHNMNNLDFPAAVEDIHQSARYLREHHGCKSVAVMGFCMGGALSVASAVLQGAAKGPLDAAVCFYGVPPAELCDPATLCIPLQAHHGEEDKLEGFSDPATFAKLGESVAKSPAAQSYEAYSYEKQGHAFMNASKSLRALAGVTQTFNQETVDQAWKRVDDFLNKHCK